MIKGNCLLIKIKELMRDLISLIKILNLKSLALYIKSYFCKVNDNRNL